MNHAAAPAAKRLPGDVFIWCIIVLELVTSSVMLVAFAFTRARHVELFNASQRQLGVQTGASIPGC